MEIKLTPTMVTQLNELLSERKFDEEEYYPGAPTEEIRIDCEVRVNRFVSDILRLLGDGTTREEVFARARALNEEFNQDDSEEKEKADEYLAAVMRIAGIEDWMNDV